MASKTLKTSVLIGGSVTGAFRSAMATTQNGLKRIGEEIAAVDRKQRLMRHSIDSFGKIGKNVDGLRRQYAELTREAENLRRAQTRLANVQSRIDANNARRRELGGKLRGAIGFAAGTAAATMFPVKHAVEFETAMLGVAKQVEGARDAGGNLTPIYFDMAKQVHKLGHELPIATNEIAGMVAAGARMGVARKDLIGFTRTAAMMSTAFDMPAEQLADDMGKIAGLFRIPIPRIGELADAINFLDDNSQAKGGEIIDVMRRVGGMAQTLKMPAKEAAALGSTFLSLGSASEVAGTATNAMLQILGAATAQSKRVRTGLESIGFDPAAIQASMANDPTGTILKLLDKLNSLGDEQRLVATARIFGKEYGDDIAKLSTGATEFRRQLALVRGEEQRGSVSREFQARMQTTAALWQTTKNRIGDVSVAIGEALLPAVNRLLNAATPVVEKFATWSQQNPGLVKGIIGTALALTGLRVATLGIGYAVTLVKAPVLSVMGFIAKWRATSAIATLGRFGPMAMRAAGAFRLIGTAVALIGGGPLALIVGALTAAGLVIRKYWQPISAWVGGFASGLRESLAPAFGELSAALQPLSPIFQGIGNAIGKAWSWFVKLLAPVNSTKAQLDGATKSGQAFGRVIGSVIGFVIDRISAAVRLIGSLRQSLGTVGSVAARVLAPFTGGLSLLATAGAGNAPASPALPPAPRGKVPPALPGNAAGRNAAPVTDARSYQISVTQQPGESGEAFARRLADQLKQQDGVARRGSLVDGVD